ncbi:SGNH/GDSL hydrolase family protein [Sphingomonas jeddahensis]|nr:SGNH/GDSL hydrolase family protein [Sphingomonas jeddahensis]
MSARDMVARGIATQARAAANAANRHARLLRAADAAWGRNPVVLPPWLAPPAYSADTSYAPGQVVANNGSWYMCGIAGTSPASGSGPTTTASGQYVPDGASALYWTCLGGARAADPGDGAPLVSVATTNPALGANWVPASFPGAYSVRGAHPSPLRTSFWSLTGFEAKPGVPMCAGASVAFACDADKLVLFLPANSGQVRIIVDGRYLTPGSHVVAGQDEWLVIDWTESSGRRQRYYELETGKSASLFGCAQTSTAATVSAAGAGEPRMVVIGDSYNAGSSYGPWLAGGSIAQLLAKRLGWRDAWNLSVGGTGYCNASASTFSTFGQRVPQALALEPDVIMLMGSSNDVGYSPAAVQAAALATLQAIRAGTAAPIVVVGVPSINLPGAAPTEAAIAAAVAQAGDPLAFFVPICGAKAPWVLGGWNNGAGAPPGTINAGLYIAADDIHPPEIGFDYYASRIEQAIRATVLPALAGG